MKDIFTAVPAQPCGRHEHIPKGERSILSCGCGLADSGCYMIAWDGPGLGLVCENEDDGQRKAFMMNVAWYLSQGKTLEEIFEAGITKRGKK